MDDVNATAENLSMSTFDDYTQALQRLFVLQDIEAWCPAIRSKTAIRSGLKRGLADPSIAVAALGLSPSALLLDMKTFGFIFECLCIRDLRAYSQHLDSTVNYYHDRYGLEADIVLHLDDGRYALIECKLGSRDIKEGAELVQLKRETFCTIYTIQFTSEDEGEYLRFVSKFKDDAELNADLFRIVQLVDKIADIGALERMFRPERKMSDRVCALPVLKSRLRLYCLRLSDKILILGNGGEKKSKTYQEDEELKGYVMTLQKFDRLIKEGERDGSIRIEENKLETEKTFDL